MLARGPTLRLRQAVAEPPNACTAVKSVAQSVTHAYLSDGIPNFLYAGANTPPLPPVAYDRRSEVTISKNALYTPKMLGTVQEYLGWESFYCAPISVKGLLVEIICCLRTMKHHA